MAGKILVPIRNGEKVEEIIPYLEKIAKPGMKVVFLFPYPVDRWLYMRDHWVTTESVKEAILAGRKILEEYSWEAQRALAEKRVSCICEVLGKVGMEVAVHVYTGSLRRVIQDGAVSEDVQFIMLRSGNGNLLTRLLSRMSVLSGLFKQTSVPPVLLLHPNRGARG